MLPFGLLLPVLLTTNVEPIQAQTLHPANLLRVLQERRCPDCDLADADLVHADLRDAQLQGAKLQRANLGQARLDGADLQRADLSFTSLQGASLRGADLRGSRLYGTDLRGADLSGAQLDAGALEQSHWQGARGIQTGVRSHPSLHNAGVDAANAGRWQDAERLFSAAIRSNPDEPLSWVARGISRGEQEKNGLASRDLAHAGAMYAKRGDSVKAKQLRLASTKVGETPTGPTATGNGIGSTLLSGTLSALQTLAPLALRALAPIMP